MNICSTVDLREKEVINLADGSKLGFISDFEICSSDARILAVILPAKTGFFGFSKNEKLVIPWEKIECIGEDAILVKIPPEDARKCRPKKKKGFLDC